MPVSTCPQAYTLKYCMSALKQLSEERHMDNSYLFLLEVDYSIEHPYIYPQVGDLENSFTANTSRFLLTGYVGLT